MIEICVFSVDAVRLYTSDPVVIVYHDISSHIQSSDNFESGIIFRSPCIYNTLVRQNKGQYSEKSKSEGRGKVVRDYTEVGCPKSGMDEVVCVLCDGRGWGGGEEKVKMEEEEEEALLDFIRHGPKIYYTALISSPAQLEIYIKLFVYTHQHNWEKGGVSWFPLGRPGERLQG